MHSNTWCCRVANESSSESLDLTDLMNMNSKSVSVLLRFLNGSLNFCTSTLRLATNGIVDASTPSSLIPFKQNKVGFSNLPQRMTFISRLMLTLLLSIYPSCPIRFSVLSDSKSCSSGTWERVKCDSKLLFFLGKFTGAFTMIKKVYLSKGPNSNVTVFSIVRVYGFSMNQQLSSYSELMAFSFSPLKGRSSSTKAEKISLLLCE